VLPCIVNDITGMSIDRSIVSVKEFIEDLIIETWIKKIISVSRICNTKHWFYVLPFDCFYN